LLREACANLGHLLGRDLARDVEQRLDVWGSLRAQLERWRADVQRLRFFRAYLAAAAALTANGCAPLVEAAVNGTLLPAQLEPAFERSVLQAWVSQVFAQEPALATFFGEQHHRRVSDFAARDRAHLEACSQVARARL